MYWDQGSRVGQPVASVGARVGALVRGADRVASAGVLTPHAYANLGGKGPRALLLCMWACSRASGLCRMSGRRSRLDELAGLGRSVRALRAPTGGGTARKQDYCLEPRSVPRVLVLRTGD